MTILPLSRWAGLLWTEIGGCAGMVLENRCGSRPAKNAGDLGEGVGSDAVRSDDGYGALIDQADARLGVDNVGVALPLVFQELERVARSGNSAVLRQDLAGFGSGQVVGDLDDPAGAA